MNIKIDPGKITLAGCQIIGDYKDLTEEQWRELRKTGIGGSDAGVIMGYSKYNSPLALWMQKTGRDPEVFEGNDATDFGNKMEPLIRERLVEPLIRQKLGGIDIEVIEPQFTYRNIDNPFMVMNVDGFVRIDGQLYGLEIKTGSSYVASQWEDDSVPDVYYCQVQHYMEGLGLDNFIVYGMIGNREVLRVVPYNEMFCEELVAAERDFWSLVQENNPLYAPAPRGTDADMKAITILNHPGSDDVADLSDVEDYIKRYLWTSNEIKQLEADKEELKQKIMVFMGQSTKGVSPEYTASCGQVTTKRLDTKALEAAHPEITQQFKKESSYIKFNAREKKK